MKAYDIRYLALGHSYLLHEAFVGWQTEGEWGMAASKPDNDYFHRFGAYLKKELPSRVQAYALGKAGFELLCKKETTREDYLNSAEYASIEQKVREFQPNLVSVFLGANCPAKDAASAELFYDVLYSLMKKTVPAETVVLCITMFDTDDLDKASIQKAAQYGFIHVSVREIHEKRGYDNPYYAYHEYPEYDGAAALGGVEFRTHPNDRGHDKIAQDLFQAAKPALVERLVPKDVIVPEAVTLHAPEEIQGETALNVTICPANAEKAVEWKVDKPAICTVDENGVLTPHNDGEVTVTAISAYDGSIMDAKTVKICGQKPSFQVFYRDDSGDTVYNLPKDKRYVRDVFNPQEGYNIPRRKGYTFAGWRVETGKEAVESVFVDKDTTFYALWKPENK